MGIIGWLGIYRDGLNPLSPRVIPSGYVKIAIENGHINSEFSHEK